MHLIIPTFEPSIHLHKVGKELRIRFSTPSKNSATWTISQADYARFQQVTHEDLGNNRCWQCASIRDAQTIALLSVAIKREYDHFYLHVSAWVDAEINIYFAHDYLLQVSDWKKLIAKINQHFQNLPAES